MLDDSVHVEHLVVLRPHASNILFFFIIPAPFDDASGVTNLCCSSVQGNILNLVAIEDETKMVSIFDIVFIVLFVLCLCWVWT